MIKRFLILLAALTVCAICIGGSVVLFAVSMSAHRYGLAALGGLSFIACLAALIMGASETHLK